MEADEFWTRAWGLDRLTALPRDPSTLFVYWELRADRRRLLARHFQAAWNDLPCALQAYDATDVLFDGSNAHSVTRYAVSPAADNWYLRELPAGRVYIVDFGVVTPSGRFFTVLRGGPAALPPNPAADLRVLAYFGRPGESVLPPADRSPPAAAFSPGGAPPFDGYSALRER